MNGSVLPGWDRLRHGGLLLDAQRLQAVARIEPPRLAPHVEQDLRRTAALAGDGDVGSFVAFVLEQVCGFTGGQGVWLRGPGVGAEWSRRTQTGESVKPRQLWRGGHGALLPVFFDTEKQLGVGRGRRSPSQVVQWLRAGTERLALLTNGRQWRLIFAGLDFDAWCEWDVDLWFEEGEISLQVHALRALVSPALWTPPADSQPTLLLAAVLDSRKGQAELSGALGERVREAVETLVQAHGDVLYERCPDAPPADIYRAAVRVVMRLVVVLFAESRELLPRDNALYHAAYGVGGLIEELEKIAARGGNRLARSWSAWPRLLALFRLVYAGSHHPALPVPPYGGELFAAADPTAADGLSKALTVFETAVLEREVFSDREVHRVLERITRTRVKVRQGRTNIWVAAPVDFSDLSSEYIGILYEGLLDFELKTAPGGDPVIFLAVGNQPALPLSRLEAMDDKGLASLLEKMKDTSKPDDASGGEEDEASEAAADEEAAVEADAVAGDDNADEDGEAGAPETLPADDPADHRHITRTRAETWARRAVEIGGMVNRPRGRLSPERQRTHEEAVSRKARQLVMRVVLPGEWYLVRWGGTRKGSGTFYTRPGLAVPTVQRALRPLAWVPPTKADGNPGPEALAAKWTPKAPEQILALKVCDPACGSGTFPVGALRFLTDTLYAAVHHHGCVSDHGDRSVVSLLGPRDAAAPMGETLGHELIPCRPDDPAFESRLKAVLRRHVVERCIYGVDLDPLGVELCRLALWIETMDRTLPFSFLDHKIKCGNALMGAWFDTFRHYPVMAFKNREGGDKGHSNGVHFAKDARGKALRDFAAGRLKEDLVRFLSGPTLFDPRDQAAEAATVHDDAFGLLARLHDLPVQDAAERARLYRDELLAAPTYRRLKDAMDLWCACWFWPPEDLADAPLPSTLVAPTDATRAVAGRIATRLRFFHWELEFPDVFRAPGSGFDAVLGNPPWENLQPNPEEFFSNFDPLFRAYGRLEKNRRLTEIFSNDASVERAWLDHSADFNSLSNWATFAATPFGDPGGTVGSGERFAIVRGRANDTLHERWRELRGRSHGYADPSHPFLYQTGRIFTYRLFLEQCHALARRGGRLGQIVPSGLYSDAWSQPLRGLFLDHCRWEWLFGFENREGIFDIHRSFKFNPVIVEKGGRTEVIRTAFMRRALRDWERAEALAVTYSREQVGRFSPKSRAILEIQSARDLDILEKIYANSVLLGDDGPNGWGIQYKLEFMMNTDAHLFPPRPAWEAKGYRPDEYSRWLLGRWRPIDELWAELGLGPARLVPDEVMLEDWLFDAAASPERRTAEVRFVHGHLLKPGDVARTPWRLRCAQPPYDALPIPRAEIPAGIILSRDGGAWVREQDVEDTALPLYEGKSISIHDWAYGERAILKDGAKFLQPRYLLGRRDWSASSALNGARVVFRDITCATNSRSFITTLIPYRPCGNPVPVIEVAASLHKQKSLLVAWLGSLVFDWSVRQRLSGTHLNWHIAESLAVPPPGHPLGLSEMVDRIALAGNLFSDDWLRRKTESKITRGIADAERLRAMIGIDAIAGNWFALSASELSYILAGCDEPRISLNGSSKGFWRVDKDKDPELRHTVLALVAFRDLEDKIRAHGGDRDSGIRAFLSQNHGESWMLPETLRLADYGLGHDERAQHAQPVASRLGPRFYDWQLAQTAEESWRECHLHARNLLGEVGYQKLLAEIEAEHRGEKPTMVSRVPEPAVGHASPSLQGKLFD